VWKRHHGFSLTEVLICLILVLLMAMLVVVTLQAALRSNQQTGGFLVARTLVSSKLSQLQAVGYGSLNGPALGQAGAKIVDGSPVSPTVAANASGTASATFEFTQTNQLATYFPGSATSDAPHGWLYIAPYTPSKRVENGMDTYLLIRATAQVQWRDSHGLLHSFSETTLIPRNAL
jgi:prepilin-type N-terminal cleavage/methylation domain-containing protein